jgi:hypothetical protein
MLASARPGKLVLVTIMASLLAMINAPSASAATYSEQQGSRGVNTFTNYHNASGVGPRIDPATWVEVSCKVYDPFIGTANPDGYWYRITSSPWNDQYYSPANTFMTGDPWGGPFTHNTDFNVPDCGSTPAPSPTVSLAQGPVASSVTGMPSRSTTSPPLSAWRSAAGTASTLADSRASIFRATAVGMPLRRRIAVPGTGPIIGSSPVAWSRTM